ncbi:hypothetical protein A8713_25575 [Streptomyces sp. SAT1]|uniref:hypothetical protein n=1 Tax=Streptomyces sp. SAT1 TaxID=1849967 RepID=UPI0007DDB6AF|nr:hypothetical protein [Streptomyces sp. SAT1]ANH94132.1 hypothetical protein A8713_25575 [Streptomyces sp. SAT1]
MADDEKRAAGNEGPPAGPFLREYAPTGGYPPVSAQRASVVFYRNGGYSVITVAGIQHVGKRALARPYTVCEIAQGTFVSTLGLELPAAGGTSFFKAEVDIEWEATDPHLVAVNVVTDVAKRLTAPVLERLREVTLGYQVTEADQANRVVTQECVGGRWSDLGSELGLRVRLYVRLGVDDEAITYAQKKREVYADAEVTRVRQEEFRRMLRGGDMEQLTYMLAADPDGAKDFLEKIRQEGRQDEKDRLDRLYSMAMAGELHAADVETQVLNLLNQGRGRPLQGPIGAVPARRQPRSLEPGGERPFTPDWASDDPPRRRPPRDRSPWDEPGPDRGSDHGSGRGSDHGSGRGSDHGSGRGGDRPDRTDRRPADGYDEDPPPRVHRPEPYDPYEDDPDRAPRRSRDDGWSWADEDR